MNIIKQMKAGDLFDRLRPERKQDVKNIKVERSPALDAIVDGFKKVVEAEYPGGYNDKEFYEFCTRHVPEKYSAKDIEYFSILLLNYQSKEEFGYKAGLYLSALTNCCKDKDVALHTSHLERLIDFIGYRDEGKHVTVKGNAGYYVGSDMKGGAIHVKGDAGNYVGRLMKDGAIHVKGNAGKYVGLDMEGGEIYINGELKSLAEDIEGGNIYHKGKLVIENGEFV